MPVRLHHIVIDAHDLPGLARFWTEALGWKVLSERENEIVIGTDENAPLGICFMPVTDPKTVKNRVHLDLTSSAADRDQEIDRLLTLGARRVEIGQTGAESWTVLADSEGNEFCVVRPKQTLIRQQLGPESQHTLSAPEADNGTRCELHKPACDANPDQPLCATRSSIAVG